MMTDTQIVIIVPVLKRPHRVRAVMENVKANTTVPYTLMFVPTYNDSEEIRELERCYANYLPVTWVPGSGDWAKKINYGYRQSSEPFIFTGADDLNFHPEWDITALDFMQDERIGVVGTNDLCNQYVIRGEHSTHSLVRRSYIDEHGTIDQPGLLLHEGYPHEYVDNELVETAKHRDAYAHAHDSVVEHLHWQCGKGERDSLFKTYPQRMRQSRQVYNRRRRLWQGQRVNRTADFTVCIGTYGDDKWRALAMERAIPSVEAQTMKPAAIIHVHGENLAQARNEAAAQANSPWLIFLDADDELHPNYIASMFRANRRSAGVLNPMVQNVIDGKAQRPKMMRTRPLDRGNYIVIGAAVRSDLFRQAGGFDPQWEAWEDYAMWRRVVALGGRIVNVPGAVYITHWNGEGRNNTVPDSAGLFKRMANDFVEWQAAR